MFDCVSIDHFQAFIPLIHQLNITGLVFLNSETPTHLTEVLEEDTQYTCKSDDMQFNYSHKGH